MKTIIVVSDLHIGSLVGLCSPDARMDGGDRVKLNKIHNTLWRYWNDFWDVFVPGQIQGSEKTVIEINGDLIDGNHHNTVTLWTNDTDTQAANTVDLLKPLKTFGDIYIVRGTEAHSGPGSKAEERIARELGVKPNENGDYSVWQLVVQVESQIFNFAHHIGVTSSAAYETSAPMREMVAALVEASQWNRPLPTVYVRSHRHRFIPVSIPTSLGRFMSIITPGWQARTPFSERIDRMRMPHIGGIVFRVEDGVCECREKLYPLPDPEPIRI